jgi:hypothetical protein
MNGYYYKNISDYDYFCFNNNHNLIIYSNSSWKTYCKDKEK